MVSRILLLDKGVIAYVGCEKRRILCRIRAFGDLTEGVTKFVLAVFAGDVSRVTWDLCSWV